MVSCSEPTPQPDGPIELKSAEASYLGEADNVGQFEVTFSTDTDISKGSVLKFVLFSLPTDDETPAIEMGTYNVSASGEKNTIRPGSGNEGSFYYETAGTGGTAITEGQLELASGKATFKTKLAGEDKEFVYTGAISVESEVEIVWTELKSAEGVYAGPDEGGKFSMKFNTAATVDGTGDIVALSLNGATDEVEPLFITGRFEVNTSGDLNTLDPGAEGPAGTYVQAADGTLVLASSGYVEVKEEGDNFNITFYLKDSAGKKARYTYVGPVEVANNGLEEIFITDPNYISMSYSGDMSGMGAGRFTVRFGIGDFDNYGNPKNNKAVYMNVEFLGTTVPSDLSSATPWLGTYKVSRAPLYSGQGKVGDVLAGVQWADGRNWCTRYWTYDEMLDQYMAAYIVGGTFTLDKEGDIWTMTSKLRDEEGKVYRVHYQGPLNITYSMWKPCEMTSDVDVTYTKGRIRWSKLGSISSHGIGIFNEGLDFRYGLPRSGKGSYIRMDLHHAGMDPMYIEPGVYHVNMEYETGEKTCYMGDGMLMQPIGSWYANYDDPNGIQPNITAFNPMYSKDGGGFGYGTVTVSHDGDKHIIEVDAYSKNGYHIQAHYAGVLVEDSIYYTED